MELPALPGQTPLDDICGLKVAGVKSRADLYAHEAANVLKAYYKYLAARPSKRLAPFDVPWLKKLHQEMLGNVWQWAGKFRRTEKNIGVPPQQIEVALTNLLEDARSWGESGMELLDQSAMLHFRCVQVHPFEDGNGRWARLLANIWLKQQGGPIVNWPEQATGTVGVIREAYIAAVKQADQGNMAPLFDLHKQFAV